MRDYSNVDVQGPSAAVGIALVNTFGACGGVGPVLVGHMKVCHQHCNSFPPCKCESMHITVSVCQSNAGSSLHCKLWQLPAERLVQLKLVQFQHPR